MKTALFLLFFLLFSLSTFSQKKFNPQFRVGLNNTNISNLNSERSFGYYVGLAYPVKVWKNKKLRIELTYDRQNTKLVQNTLSAYHTNRFNI